MFGIRTPGFLDNSGIENIPEKYRFPFPAITIDLATDEVKLDEPIIEDDQPDETDAACPTS